MKNCEPPEQRWPVFAIESVPGSLEILIQNSAVGQHTRDRGSVAAARFHTRMHPRTIPNVAAVEAVLDPSIHKVLEGPVRRAASPRLLVEGVA